MHAMVVSLVVGQMYATIPLIPRSPTAWHTITAAAATATTAFAVGYACGSLASGAMATVFGRRRVMVGSVAVLAVATALIPLIGTLAAVSAARRRHCPRAVRAARLPQCDVPAERLPVALTAISATLAVPKRSTDCHLFIGG
jgi:MFS family permease